MFAFKKKYYLIIQSIKDIDLKNIKLVDKFTVIYRNNTRIDNLIDLGRFRQECRRRRIDFFVANNPLLLIKLKADGLYISSHNKNLNLAKFKNHNFEIIGSAHNINEINIKNKQGCSHIIFSRLFKTTYSFKKNFLGVVRFNLLKSIRNNSFIPLGGIRLNNLNKLKMVNSIAFAVLSEVKKKPAIISRLF
jgi:thiamine-phosphate pyrophosphorylase